MRPRSSRKGLSSTRSRLVTSWLSCSISMTRCASRKVVPPGTVVPTPGAISGSRKSDVEADMQHPAHRGDTGEELIEQRRDALLVDGAHVVHDDARRAKARRARAESYAADAHHEDVGRLDRRGEARGTRR